MTGGLSVRPGELPVLIDNLRAAGMHVPADALTREAESMRRQLRDRPMSPRPPAGPAAPELRELREEVTRMQAYFAAVSAAADQEQKDGEADGG